VVNELKKKRWRDANEEVGNECVFSQGWISRGKKGKKGRRGGKEREVGKKGGKGGSCGGGKVETGEERRGRQEVQLGSPWPAVSSREPKHPPGYTSGRHPLISHTTPCVSARHPQGCIAALAL